MTISAVLLAGGQSRRMGEDKARMLFRGAPLWKSQLGLLRRIEFEKIFVSARIDPPWRPADVDLVLDAQPSRGALSGIAATLSRIKSDHLLALAIDIPFMNEAYLRKLCGQIKSNVGIYPRDAGAEFARALSGDDFSLQPLVRRLVALEKLQPMGVLPEERFLFRNLNEPRDLADA
jgi:molybdenum cofactor guanylyltransferase